MAWKPGKRAAAIALEEPYEDVPDHLRGALWQWVENALRDELGYDADPGKVLVVAMRLRDPFDGNARVKLNNWRERSAREPTLVLDLIEEILGEVRLDYQMPGALRSVLELGNSAYTVNEKGDGLEHRVAPGVREAVESVVGAASRAAGEHLTAAWNNAYGFTSDPPAAYSEAVMAVEAALAAHVSPDSPRQTLGSMIRDIRAKPQKWIFVLGADRTSHVETVIAMMNTLWVEQTRHAGTEDTRRETIEEARAAVHLAAALVQFGTSGAFRRAGTP